VAEGVKIAIITGTDSGMGPAMMEELAKQGADIAVSFHTDEVGAEESQARVAAVGRCAIVQQLDVRDGVSVTFLFEAVNRAVGAPDILVNNTGIGAGGSAVAETTTEEFDNVIKTDLYMVCSSAAANLFAAVKTQAAVERSSISRRCTRRCRALAMQRMACPNAVFSRLRAASQSSPHRCEST